MALPLRAILFDLDGTLLDTAPEMVDALNAVRVEQGLAPLAFEEVRPSVSHGSTRLINVGFPDADPQRFTVLQSRFLQIYAAGVGLRTHLFNGMESVLAELSNRGLSLGVVTNKPAWLTDPLLAQLDLHDRFKCVVSGDTVSERKPHPLPMLHAAKLAGAAAEACIYVGDAERDVQAAHAAGMPALVATYGYLRADEDWQAWGGDGAVAQPADLIGWLDRSGRA